MALTLTRAVSMKFQIVGRQLREVSQSWFRRAHPRADVNPEALTHAYSHLHKSGEMNHMGRHHCDACDAEMRLAPAADAGGAVTGPRCRWQCPGCGARDETSFRICRCGRQTVLEKHAASARELPVSLNAGGCTECERCVVCDGVLAVGNLKWFYGRWTHLYPDTEADGRTGQQYAVTRERSKYYGFHCHFSCCEKDPQASVRHLTAITPDWYTQGIRQQQHEEAVRLHKEGRCRVCRARLDWWSRALDRDCHPKCSS
jgi:hypothetical protein